MNPSTNTLNMRSDEPFPCRKDTMMLQKIPNSKPRYAFDDQRNLSTADIPGAQVPQPKFIDRVTIEHSDKPQRLIPETVNKPIRNLTNKDIEGSWPTSVNFTTARVVNPLNPVYPLSAPRPIVECVPRFLKDSMMIDDIPGTRYYRKYDTKPTKDIMYVADIPFAQATKVIRSLDKQGLDNLDVSDINYDGMHFRTRHIDPLSPRYRYDVPRTDEQLDSVASYHQLSLAHRDRSQETYDHEGNWVIGGIDGSHPKPRRGPKKNAPYFTLMSKDIEGNEPGFTRRDGFEKRGLTRRHVRTTNWIHDVEMCFSGSRLRVGERPKIAHPAHQPPEGGAPFVSLEQPTPSSPTKLDGASAPRDRPPTTGDRPTTTPHHHHHHHHHSRPATGASSHHSAAATSRHTATAPSRAQTALPSPSRASPAAAASATAAALAGGGHASSRAHTALPSPVRRSAPLSSPAAAAAAAAAAASPHGSNSHAAAAASPFHQPPTPPLPGPSLGHEPAATAAAASPHQPQHRQPSSPLLYNSGELQQYPKALTPLASRPPSRLTSPARHEYVTVAPPAAAAAAAAVAGGDERVGSAAAASSLKPLTPINASHLPPSAPHAPPPPQPPLASPQQQQQQQQQQQHQLAPPAVSAPTPPQSAPQSARHAQAPLLEKKPAMPVVTEEAC